MAGSLRFGAANRHGVVFSLLPPVDTFLLGWDALLVACAVLPMLVAIVDPILYYGSPVDSVLLAGQLRYRQKFLLLQWLNITANALHWNVCRVSRVLCLLCELCWFLDPQAW